MNKQTPKIDFYQIRDFGQVFNAGFSFLGQNFKQLFLHQLSIGGPFLLVGAGAQSFLTLQFQSLLKQDTDWTNMGISYLVNIISFVIGWVMISAVINSYIKLYQESPDSKPDIQLGQIWDQVKKDFWWLLGRTILYYLVFTLIVGAIVGMGFLVFTSGSSTGFKVGFGFLYFLGTGSLILYLCPYMGLFMTQSYFERTNFSTSISRTFYLIRNYWWLSFGLGVVNAIIMGVISGILSWPFMIVTGMQGLLQASEGTNAAGFSSMVVINVIAIFARTLSYLLTLSLHYVMAAVYYHSQLELKDGTGLLNRIQSIGNEQATKQAPVDFYDEEEKY